MSTLSQPTLPAKPRTEITDEPFVDEATVGMGQIAWLNSDDTYLPVYGATNSVRLPTYQKFDLHLEKRIAQFKGH